MKGPEDDAGLAGKVAIISGGGAAGDGIGNGRAAAILLARAGARVLVADLDLKLAERTAEMIKAEGGTAAAHAGDVTKEAECKRLVDAAVDRWGRLDFLDNNVGIGSRASAQRKLGGIARVVTIAIVTIMVKRFWVSAPIDRPTVAMITSVEPRAFIPVASASASWRVSPPSSPQMKAPPNFPIVAMAISPSVSMRS